MENRNCKLQIANCKLQICILHFAFCNFFCQSAPPDFVLTMTDGTQAVGSVEKIANDWSVRLISAKPISKTGLEAVSLRRDKTQLPGPPQGEQVILVNGDRIPGKIQELTNDRLHVQVDSGKE